MMRKAAMVCIIFIVGCLQTNSPIDISKFVSLKEGSVAPQFSFESTTGNIVSLQDYTNSGKPTIIITISPGCISCNKSLTHHALLYDDYSQKVEFIGFNVGGDDFGNLKEYVERKGFRGEYVNVDAKTIEEYGIVSTDIMYIIDSDGIVKDVTVTPRSQKAWKDVFERVA